MADLSAYADLLEIEEAYGDLLEDDPVPEPQGTAGTERPQPRRREVVPTTMLGSALESLGILDPGVIEPDAPEVGAGETALSSAVGMLPAGRTAANLLSAAALQASEETSRALPAGLLRAASQVPGLGSLAPVPGPGAVLTPEARQQLREMGEAAPQERPAEGPVDKYRRLREVAARRQEAGNEQNPVAGPAGGAVGFGLGLLAPLPRATPKGSGLGARAAAAAKTGAGYGGLAGLTEGGADLSSGDVVGTAKDILYGVLTGGVVGGALPLLAAPFRRASQGIVTPTPAAEALKREGVDNLTLGQQAGPESAVGRFEGAAQSNPVIGPILRGQRGAAEDSWRNVVANASRAPGAERIPQGATMPEAMRRLSDGYGEVYGAVRDATVPVYRLGDILPRVVNPTTKMEAGATTADVKRAADFIRTQMSRIPEGDEVVPGRIVLDMRQQINRAIREESLKKDPNLPYARILQEADDALSEGLEASLPDDVANALRAADKQYRNFKILQRAEVAAGDTAEGQGVFSAPRLVTAVRQSTPDSVYDKGGGGPLRDLAANAAQSFAEPPKTGYAPAMAGGPLGYVFSPFMALANTPAVKPLALGQTPAQQGMREMDALLSQYLNPAAADYAAADALIGALRRRQENR